MAGGEGGCLLREKGKLTLESVQTVMMFLVCVYLNYSSCFHSLELHNAVTADDTYSDNDTHIYIHTSRELTLHLYLNPAREKCHFLLLVQGKWRMNIAEAGTVDDMSTFGKLIHHHSSSYTHICARARHLSDSLSPSHSLSLSHSLCVCMSNLIDDPLLSLSLYLHN